MTSMTQPDGMDRRIFETGLPVEAISLYLLCCDVARNDVPLTVKTIENRWNSTEDALKSGLALLLKHSILVSQTEAGAETVYALQDAPKWQF